jgi:L-lactate dehydrogenase complex protein LldG
MNFTKIISLSSHFKSKGNLELPEDPHALEDLGLAILDGQFGVAENGAIWMEDSNLGLRALPFITEHLVIVLDRKNLVETMHQGYERIGNATSGFGLFIAGPSKTADIEQSLVIGAHGAKSLRVVLV